MEALPLRDSQRMRVPPHVCDACTLGTLGPVCLSFWVLLDSWLLKYPKVRCS
uniref:Uncharacterized protein n=1 Tax=Arundo donax TaxID=35708 RepID=A0A0A9FMT8_ARUDO